VRCAAVRRCCGLPSGIWPGPDTGLRAWPDTREALRRFAVVPRSNGNLYQFAAPRLAWHCVRYGEMVHAYKPDPAVCRLAMDRLVLNPRRTLMVAAPRHLPAATGFAPLSSNAQARASQEPSDAFNLIRL
jgi:hypothetical protein